MNTFVKRTLTATVFAAIMLGGICLNQWSFTILFFIINAGALWEYYGLVSNFYSVKKIKADTYRYTGVAAGSIFYICFSYFLVRGDEALLEILFPVLLPILLIFIIIELYSSAEKGIVNAALNIFGIAYISFPLALLHCISTRYTFFQHAAWAPNGFEIVLGILLMVWANDTFAYIGGSLIGRHKLFPSISPNKTWEGFIIGIAGSVIVSIIFSAYFKELELRDWIIISVIVSVTGTLGDLFESMLKRNAGVKDSGSIMPGHGGFLDRFDAFIFCIPFIYTYITLFHV